MSNYFKHFTNEFCDHNVLPRENKYHLRNCGTPFFRNSLVPARSMIFHLEWHDNENPME